ncbi:MULTISPECIES: rhodanese-like domain-containing protein [Bacillus]|uniref:rhodanese-like domain-containing protein n=1 Tax=Bacillus TaxID=1386 RepID=UPI000377EBED|nr:MULTISPECIES: rhodanese-like domain-containing protein [Bacillus]PEP57009.1 rhodanese-like domain-containing protein [Bacillus pseudomycoides]PGR94687.1 rhodanese-like domain-containing protein [Bacillus pseudomycoides]PHC92365.1 rhodanese-like domain-containing protein [Bacillus pseudomycoides]
MSANVVFNIVLTILDAWFIISRFLPVKGVKNINGKELKTEMNKKNKQFIDVRTPGEFRGNHIQGFQNIPLNELAQKASHLDKNKEVIVICQSGMRSKQATKMLKKLGFQHITNVSGGMNAWN